MIQDITERKPSQQELSRAQACLAEAERLSHIGTGAVNVITQEIVFWSDEHYRIFGFDPERGIPPLSTVLERWHPDDADTQRDFYDAVAQKRDYQFEFRLILPDGTNPQHPEHRAPAPQKGMCKASRPFPTAYVRTNAMTQSEVPRRVKPTRRLVLCSL